MVPTSKIKAIIARHVADRVESRIPVDSTVWEIIANRISVKF